MRKLTVLLLASSTFMAVPAFAQDPGDVVMRRPLPTSNSPTQTEIPGDPTDPDGFGPPTPANVPDPPSVPNARYYWDIGEWDPEPACGTSQTITREIKCLMYADGQSDGDEGIDGLEVPHSYCVGYDGPAPSARYTGSGACPGLYQPEYTMGQWMLDDGMPGTASCSPHAYRYADVTGCRSPQGQSVDVSLCHEWGDYSDYPETEYGNTAGCSGEWTEDVEAACSGPTYTASVTYRCRSPEGALLPDSVCTGQKPVDTTRTGQCQADYLMGNRGQRCVGEVMAQAPLSGGHHADDVLGPADSFCQANGATCCEARLRYPGGYEVWAFGGSATSFQNDHSINDQGGRWNPGDPLPRFDLYGSGTEIIWHLPQNP